MRSFGLCFGSLACWCQDVVLAGPAWPAIQRVVGDSHVAWLRSQEVLPLGLREVQEVGPLHCSRHHLCQAWLVPT